jgi:hypothetical protein
VQDEATQGSGLWSREQTGTSPSAHFALTQLVPVLKPVAFPVTQQCLSGPEAAQRASLSQTRVLLLPSLAHFVSDVQANSAVSALSTEPIQQQMSPPVHWVVPQGSGPASCAAAG